MTSAEHHHRFFLHHGLRHGLTKLRVLEDTKHLNATERLGPEPR
jgi:hypothetical protein